MQPTGTRFSLTCAQYDLKQLKSSFYCITSLCVRVHEYSVNSFNALPEKIKLAMSTNSFKKELNKHLMLQYWNNYAFLINIPALNMEVKYIAYSIVYEKYTNKVHFGFIL